MDLTVESHYEPLISSVCNIKTKTSTVFQSKGIFALGEEEEWKQYPQSLTFGFYMLSRVSEVCM